MRLRRWKYHLEFQREHEMIKDNWHSAAAAVVMVDPIDTQKSNCIKITFISHLVRCKNTHTAHFEIVSQFQMIFNLYSVYTRWLIHSFIHCDCRFKHQKGDRWCHKSWPLLHFVIKLIHVHKHIFFGKHIHISYWIIDLVFVRFELHQSHTFVQRWGRSTEQALCHPSKIWHFHGWKMCWMISKRKHRKNMSRGWWHWCSAHVIWYDLALVN